MAAQQLYVSGNYYSVWCENCELQTPERLSEKEVIAKWNRRAYEKLHEAIQECAMMGYSRAEAVNTLKDPVNNLLVGGFYEKSYMFGWR